MRTGGGAQLELGHGQVQQSSELVERQQGERGGKARCPHKGPLASLHCYLSNWTPIAYTYLSPYKW